MKKIFSQLAGAAAVVAAVSAGLAYAQVSPSPSTSPSASAPANTQPVDQRMNTGSAATAATTTVKPLPSEDPKSSSTDSRYGPGANNGSTYNPAIRSTELKPGNVSSVDDPVARTTTTPAATTPPAAMPMQSSTLPDNGTSDVAPTPAPATGTTDGNWNADGTRAARADRN